ncbi:MAG TPA: hypothetical protein VND65_00255 [Candidatus Binatia bacterium]|nr:hypothetical protein [Candidatus Binatia bacterium]
MKFTLLSATVVTLLAFASAASARDVVLPAGTLLQCTLNEPNFSSATAEVGDPVLCHLRGVSEFGQQAFPRGSYLVGHLESAKDPGHFFGKGYLKLQFDRIGLPTGDLPLEAKVISTRGYKVDKHGQIDGKGHAKRDVVEWMLPPLWPWKVIMLPARGPRPQLKGETVLSLRLMDDVELPQTASLLGPGWHYFSKPKYQSYQSQNTGDRPVLAVRGNVETADTQISAAVETPALTYASLVSRNVSVASLPTSSGNPLFVLKTGMVLAVGNYQYQDGRITYTLASGGGGVINADDIDWNATTRVNNQRGVRTTLHGGHIASETPGF